MDWNLPISNARLLCPTDRANCKVADMFQIFNRRTVFLDSADVGDDVADQPDQHTQHQRIRQDQVEEKQDVV